MRHLRLKFKIIWLIFTDQYTNSLNDRCWYLWRKTNDKNYIKITFDCDNWSKKNWNLKNK